MTTQRSYRESSSTSEETVATHDSDTRSLIQMGNQYH
jgi:hypothetical protein